MISEPGRYIDEYIDAGCDSITFHVEIDEPIEPTLRAIRAAGRAAGLAIKPGTPLEALEPYAELLDIVLVMTVEPGFGKQKFMKDVAQAKLLAARHYLRFKAHGGEVHVDGGVNRETAEIVGAQGTDILVVGSALWIKGHDMAREIRLIRSLADEGYQFGLNDGVPPIPRDHWTTFASLPQPHREAGDGRDRGGRDPGPHAPRPGRLQPRRRARLRPERADLGRSRSSRSVTPPLVTRGSPRPRRGGRPGARSSGRPPCRARDRARSGVRALLQRVTGASVPVDGEVVGAIGPGRARRAPRRRAHRTTWRRPRRSPGASSTCASSATTRAGRTGRCSTWAARPSSSPSSRSTPTRAAVAGRASRTRPCRSSAIPCYERFCAAVAAAGVTVARGRFGAEMAVELVNDGPFTIWLDTDER